MEFKPAFSLPWLLLLIFSSRPAWMALIDPVQWDASSVCLNPNPEAVCYPSDPTHNWVVELPECSTDRIWVNYSDYSGGADGRVLGDLTFQQILLQCTAPEGADQAELTPTSLSCSGTSTGGNQRLGFEFQNLGAVGVQSGWTCTIGGCYTLNVAFNGSTVWLHTPPITFTVGDCGPTTEPPTTSTAPPTTSTGPPVTTTASQPATTSNTSIPDTTEEQPQELNVVTELYAVMVPLITVLLVALFVIMLTVFALLSRRKLQRDRKRTILIFDEKNMVFDPDNMPAVCIEKPISHRISVVSNDFLQYLDPINSTGLHGSEKMTILVESCPDGDNDVFFKIDDTTSRGRITDADNLPQDLSENARDPPPDYSSVCNSELTLHHGEVSGYVLEGNREYQVTEDNHSVMLSDTKRSASVATDSSSLLVSQIGPSGNDESCTTNLDKQYCNNSSGGGYVDLNGAQPSAVPQALEKQLSSANIFELNGELDSSEKLPVFPDSAVSTSGTTSYIDSTSFEMQHAHHNITLNDLNFDSSHLHLDNSGVSLQSDLSSLHAHLHDHTTSDNGYVSDGQTPPTDGQTPRTDGLCRSEEDENLELDPVTESDGYLTGEDDNKTGLANDTVEDRNQSRTSVKDAIPEPSTNVCFHYSPPASPDSSPQSQGYVKCDGIVSSDDLARKIVLPRNHTSSPETRPGYVVHLDFSGQTDTSQNPLSVSGAGLKMDKAVLHSLHGVELDDQEHYLNDNNNILPEDNSQQESIDTTGQYIVYDFRPMRHLLSDNSGTDCLSIVVPDGQSSESVQLQPLLAYYPSDSSSGYLSSPIN